MGQESRPFVFAILCVSCLYFIHNVQVAGVDVDDFDGLVKSKEKSANLSCIAFGTDDYPNHNYTFEWSKDGYDLRHNGSYVIHQEGQRGMLTINGIDERKVGPYTCKVLDPVTGEYKSGHPTLEAEPFVEIVLHKDEKSITRWVGEDVSIVCTVFSYPAPSSVEWVYDSHNLTTNETHEGHAVNVTLTLHNLTVEARGEYMCRAQNTMSNGVASDKKTVLLRVKDPISALWPFIGILAEILLLAVIIIVYEVQKKKKLKQKQNVNGAEQRLMQTNASSTTDCGKDLRHRK